VLCFSPGHLPFDQLAVCSQKDHGQRYPRQFTIVMLQSTQRELSESQPTFASAHASTVKFRLAKETMERSPVSRIFSPKTRARLTPKIDTQKCATLQQDIPIQILQYDTSLSLVFLPFQYHCLAQLLPQRKRKGHSNCISDLPQLLHIEKYKTFVRCKQMKIDTRTSSMILLGLVLMDSKI
jgi:hypothetical protein